MVLPEPSFLRKIAGIRPVWVELLGVLGSVLLAAASFVQGGWRTGFFGLGVVCVVGSVILRAYQESRKRRERELWDKTQMDRSKNLMSNLNMVVIRVNAAMNVAGKRERQEHLHGVRMMILGLAGNLIGGDQGVRVSYFQVESPGVRRLVAPEWGVMGNVARPSRRVFTIRDKSLILALRGEGRLVGDTQSLSDDEGNQLRYGTFAVAPVLRVIVFTVC